LPTTSLRPALTWTPQGFAANLRVTLADDGRISAVDAAADLSTDEEDGLAGHALLPGFVNAHSHAFQRGLRGKGQTFPGSTGTFWTWRQAMYGLVGQMTPESLHLQSLRAFSEMRRVGFTSVGEFHYLRHDAPGDFAFDDVVIGAAREAGIRLALLLVAYQTSDCAGAPLSDVQARFGTLDLPRYWDRLDDLRDRGLAVGVVAHSIRAVPPATIAELWAGAVARGIPMHMHVEEQPQEIRSAQAAFGKSPMAVLLEILDGLGDAGAPPFTAVHCTHSDAAELEQFLRRGGRVCVCPTTEADLGDGIPHGEVLARFAGQISVGTDSNARISALEELRWLEHGQRWRQQTRGAWRDGEGRVGTTLLDIGSRGGAASLSLGAQSGRIEVGAPADLVAVDLSHPSLAGVSADELPVALILGCPDSVITDTWVGGERLRVS
jgi:formimidoylglutamate deiminase